MFVKISMLLSLKVMLPSENGDDAVAGHNTSKWTQNFCWASNPHNLTLGQCNASVPDEVGSEEYDLNSNTCCTRCNTVLHCNTVRKTLQIAAKCEHEFVARTGTSFEILIEETMVAKQAP